MEIVGWSMQLSSSVRRARLASLALSRDTRSSMPSILEDKDAIRDLIVAYCHYADAGDPDRWASLFTEDAVWDGGPFGKHEGRAAIRAQYEGAKSRNRHVMANILVSVDGDEASAPRN